MNKQYLGDGVYAEFDGYYGVQLTSENGIQVLDTIYIEPKVMAALVVYWHNTVTREPEEPNEQSS